MSLSRLPILQIKKSHSSPHRDEKRTIDSPRPSAGEGDRTPVEGEALRRRIQVERALLRTLERPRSSRSSLGSIRSRGSLTLQRDLNTRKAELCDAEEKHGLVELGPADQMKHPIIYCGGQEEIFMAQQNSTSSFLPSRAASTHATTRVAELLLWGEIPTIRA